MSIHPGILPANRIANFQPYFFASLNKRITELKKRNIDIIRLDMGSPDLPPEDFIIDTLVASARRPDMHRYMPIGGTPGFREAAAEYYRNRFDVDFDPKTEVLSLLGTKEGLFHLAQVILNPGDIALVPDPGYPVYSAGTLIAGGEIFSLPLTSDHDFLPDFDAIPIDIAHKAKLLWLNYPNNPTGAIAPFSFFQKAVGYAREHNILLAHDSAYNDVCFDGYQAPSLMQVPGAKEIAVEFNSLSKTYNMGGWRLGMVVGNSEVIRYLDTYKSQLDSSTFGPILEAGGKALTGDQTWLEGRNQIYKLRRDIVLSGIKEAGLSAQKPHATIYVWMQLPRDTNSTEFCNQLLEETGVSMTPGIVYGKFGEGFVRISLGLETERIQEGMTRFASWAKQHN